MEIVGDNHVQVDTHGEFGICTERLSALEPLAVAAQAQPAPLANDNAVPKFKVGDVVRAIRSSGGCVTARKEYTVLALSYEGRHLHFTNNNGDYDGWGADNFVLVVAAQPTAIVALIENGQPKPATRPYVHTTEESATKEAERLALLHPGQEFGVYVLAGSKIADEVITKTAVLRAA